MCVYVCVHKQIFNMLQLFQKWHFTTFEICETFYQNIPFPLPILQGEIHKFYGDFEMMSSQNIVSHTWLN